MDSCKVAIPITKSMIKAGVRAYMRADERVQSDEEIVSEIFRAMSSAERPQDPENNSIATKNKQT